MSEKRSVYGAPNPPWPAPDHVALTTGGTFDSLEHETPAADLAALERLSDLAIFPGGGSHETGDTVAVEVGSWVGGTARVFARHFDRVFCIDTFEGTPSDRIGEVARRHGSAKVLDTFCRNMGPDLFTTVVPLVGRSVDWARRWPAQVDLVFLDADHSYAAVAADIAAWRPIVRPGGILCGHDFGSFLGVTRAVVEAFGDRYSVEGSVWWVHV